MKKRVKPLVAAAVAESTDRRTRATNKQTNRCTSPLRKAPTFVAEA